MSFSFGIGDLLAVSKLAHDIWSRVHDSSDQFLAIQNEFRGLYIVLNDIGQRLPGLKLDSEQIAHLVTLTQASHDVLNDISDLLEKFAMLGVKPSGLRDKATKAMKRATWDERSVRDLRGRIVSNTTLLNTFLASLTSKIAQSMTDEVTTLVGQLHGLQIQNEDQVLCKVLDSVSTLDYATKLNAILDQRQEGTGQWFLDSKEVRDWMWNKGRTLLCTGMPGAGILFWPQGLQLEGSGAEQPSGKTMLASITIEHLIKTFRSQQDNGVAYIYCDYKVEHEQGSPALLASLLKQLVQQKSSVPDHVRELYGQPNNRSKPSCPSFKMMFESLSLTVASFSQVYIVVDALDELQQGGQVVQVFLSKLSELKAQSSVNLMLTSRVIPRVTDFIQSDVTLEVRAKKEDVMRYIDAHIEGLPKSVSRSSDLKQTVKGSIVDAVDGMFLLARLHLESLVDKMTPNEVRIALESLPKENEALSVAYDQAMRRIEAQKPGMRLIAQKALGWITYAKRLLSVDELRYAIAVQRGHYQFNEEDLSDIDDIVSACGGLITVDHGQDGDTVRLVHYSTQQFLIKTGGKYFPDALEINAVCCLTYLLYNTFERGWWHGSGNSNINHGRFMQERVMQHPLLCYAARYWASHANECSAQSVMDLSLRFLRDDYKVSSAAQVLFVRIANKYATEGFLRCGLDSQYGNPISGMHFAVYFGFEDMVLTLLVNGFEADLRDAAQRSPLFWAAQMGHGEIVSLLLSFKGQHVDLKRQRGRSGAAIKILQTTNGVDVNCKDIEGNTPLTVAASHGHVSVVKELLGQASILPNLASKDGCTALIYAIRRGDGAMVRLLTKVVGLDINVEPPTGRTALMWAINGGRHDLVSILLSHTDIDVNLESHAGETPLIAATSKKHESIVKLLLSHPTIDVDYQSRDGMTALTVATICGSKPIEKLLLASTRRIFTHQLHAPPLYHDGYGGDSKRQLWSVLPQMSFKFHTDRRCFRKPHFSKEPHNEVDILEYQSLVEILEERTDDEVHFIGEEGNILLSRVAHYSQDLPDPRLERMDTLLNTALKDRFRPNEEKEILSPIGAMLRSDTTLFDQQV